MGRWGRAIAAAVAVGSLTAVVAAVPVGAQEEPMPAPAADAAPEVPARPTEPVPPDDGGRDPVPDVGEGELGTVDPLGADVPGEGDEPEAPPVEEDGGTTEVVDEVIEPEPASAAVAATPTATEAVEQAQAAAAAVQLTIVVLMIDITEQARRGDASCADVNGDGLRQVVDCEIAAALAVVEAMASSNVRFVLMYLAAQPYVRNYATSRYFDPFVSADETFGGDVPVLLRDLLRIGTPEFYGEGTTYERDPGAVPDIPAALDLLADLWTLVYGRGDGPPNSTYFDFTLFEGGIPGDFTGFLFSPGGSAPGPSSPPHDPVSTLEGALHRLEQRGVVVHTFPTGSASTGCGASVLGIVAARTGGACRTITSTADAECEARSVALGGAGCGAATLPRTGGDPRAGVVAAAVLVLVGGALVLLARRHLAALAAPPVGSTPVGSATIGS